MNWNDPDEYEHRLDLCSDVKTPADGRGWVGDFFYLTLEGARAVLLPVERISQEDALKMCSLTGPQAAQDPGKSC